MIIGAGIGGLTAAAYLARAGVNVLVVERTEKAGGYCGTFFRDGFKFDEAVHYINNLAPGSSFHSLCDELGVFSRVQLIRIDPSDHLVMGALRFSVYRDLNRTVKQLQDLFPEEAEGITRFFETVAHFNFSELYGRYSKKTLYEVLGEFFHSRQLVTVLGIFAATLGLLPDQLSGLAGLAYYRGSILDGGYHPIGGAQAFANALRDIVTSHGGEITYGRHVQRISISPRGVEGVVLDDGTDVQSRVVISNCDVTQTFLKLVGRDHFEEDVIDRIEHMRPSLSNFVVYLGLRGSLEADVPTCCNLWYFPFKEYREASVDLTKDDREDGFVHISFPSLHDRTMAPKNHESVILFAGASFRNEEYWRQRKESFMELLIRRASRVIPHLEERIVVKLPGTPQTLLRYTLNREGSYRGWAPTPDQAKLGLVPQRTQIPGLLLAGHWITTPVGHGGVSMVAMSGRSAAKLAMGILKKNRRDVPISTRLQ